MNIDLPYMEKVSMADIAKARKEETAFQDFRSALQKACSTLEAETDVTNLQKRADEICQDLIHKPLAEIDQRLKNFKATDRFAFGVGLVSFGFAVFSGGTSLIASAAGANFAGAVIQKKEQQAIRQMPQHLDWDVTKEARKQ